MIFASSDHDNHELWPSLVIKYDSLGNSNIPEKQDILIYPNPTSGMISIDNVGGDVELKSIQVVNSIGSLVIDENNSRIKRKENGYTCDFTGLESGSYIFYIYTELGILTHKEIFIADK